MYNTLFCSLQNGAALAMASLVNDQTFRNFTWVEMFSVLITVNAMCNSRQHDIVVRYNKLFLKCAKVIYCCVLMFTKGLMLYVSIYRNIEKMVATIIPIFASLSLSLPCRHERFLSAHGCLSPDTRMV